MKFLFKPFFVNETVNGVLAVLLFLLYAALLLGVVVKLWRGRKEEVTGRESVINAKGRRRAFFTVGCVSILAAIILFGFLASILIRPIFVYR